MKSSAKNMHLTSVDELFSTEESRTEATREKVVELPLDELHPFKNHPFKVVNDEKMQDTAQSIRDHGVLIPAIVRPRAEGGYEIVAGHRRHFASQLAGLTTMPAIVRDMDDDTATLMMVDSNIQRESLLPRVRSGKTGTHFHLPDKGSICRTGVRKKRYLVFYNQVSHFYS